MVGFKTFYKLGRAGKTSARLGSNYSTYYPAFLGGFGVYGILNVASNNVPQEETRMLDMAHQYNFNRVTQPRMTEFFDYDGTDIYLDSKSLLQAVRGRKAGALQWFTASGHGGISPGSHIDTDRVIKPPSMKLRGKRQYVTNSPSVRLGIAEEQRALRPSTNLSLPARYR